MKKIFLFLLMSILLISLPSCNDESEYINWEFQELPETAQTFVAAYFNQYDVNKVKKSKKENERGSVYEIILRKNILKASLSSTSSGVKIEFDRAGEWTEIESLIDNSSLPEDIIKLLPSSVEQYIETNYPDSYISEVEKGRTTYKVEVEINRNDIELYFDLSGNFLKIDR